MILAPKPTKFDDSGVQHSNSIDQILDGLQVFCCFKETLIFRIYFMTCEFLAFNFNDHLNLPFLFV